MFGYKEKGILPRKLEAEKLKPANVNNSGNREKWLYSNDFIVVFTAGVVSTVIQ